VSDAEAESYSAPIRILHFAGLSKPWHQDMRNLVKQLEASNAFNNFPVVTPSKKASSQNGGMAITLRYAMLMRLWLQLEKELLELEAEE
jgi:lipopolysaccharide biosynthesis glycosyltransferase